MYNLFGKVMVLLSLQHMMQPLMIEPEGHAAYVCMRRTTVTFQAVVRAYAHSSTREYL